MNDKKKLKRKLALSFVMLLLLAVMLAFSGITLAWFYKGNDQIPADTLSGSIHAAYFNGGNGTVPSANATYKTEGSTYPSYEYGGTNGPYQIDNATQLYNFAWLQYLGYFDDTTYFVLTDNINASSIVLPPVGTSDNPFVGYFDGNGYTISGLRVSNDKTELNNTDVDGNKFNIPHQALENEELTDSAEIVGFFGVVGEIDEDYTSASFVPTVKNLTLSGATIETQTSNSLAGIAAGYVNGVMEGVVVSGTSTITNAENNVTPLSYTGNLSDYALVGFCEEPYRKVLKAETVDVYEPDVELGSLGRLGDAGSGNAWGNSIDMKSIYQELRNKYNTSHALPISYVSAKTVEHYNGTSTVFSTVTATVAASINGNKLRTTKTLANGSEIASYALIQQEKTDDFVYLYGDTEIASPSVSITDIYKEDSYCICYDSNYLTSDLQNTTTAEDAGKWVFKQNGDGTYKIYTISSNTEQYLYMNSNNTLSVGSIQDNWTVEQSYDNKFVISKDGYTLCFKNGLWKLLPPAKNYITDSSKTNYLSVSGGSVANQTNVANAASWDKETFGDGYKLKTVVGSTVYYLKSDDYNVSVTVSAEDAAVWNEIPANGNSKPKIYTNINNNNGKALYYDGTRWKLVDYTIGGAGNDWGGSVNFKKLNSKIYNLTKDQSINEEFQVNSQSDNIYLNMSQSGNSDPESNLVVYRFRDKTHIPLNYYTDDVNSPNTGYIIGHSLSGVNAAVREASYSINYLNSSLGNTSNVVYDNSKIEILTYYNNNWVRIKDSHNKNNTIVHRNITNKVNTRETVETIGFQKYEDAWNELDERLLSGSSYVHGIHFDSYAISSSSTYNIPTAVINGETYQNYVVPSGCIDFNLKEEGKINFFAGSYNSTSTQEIDCFFGIYKITRNGNSISTQKISKIYTNNGNNPNDTNTYVYQFGNTIPSNAGTLLFDMSILDGKAPVRNALYYFEIPVNAGEYAMGAVDANKKGGTYLIYLDISANATVEGDSQFNPGETADPVDKKAAGMVEKTVSSTENASIMTPPTYFPLAWDNGEVSSSNTGYVISGANAVSSPPGDIRVSKYEKSYTSNWRGIGNSLTNGILTDSKIYTYKLGNNGGWQTISQYGTDNLYKYLNSKAQLQETIGSGSAGDVYGLHFMNASIGTSNLITVPDATINGHTYTDYEMPRDSIDFNLKTPGYINVFAGTYFSGSQNGVNCFFSLHKIERDADQKITSVREIKAIYEDNGSYNYQYVGGSAPSGTKVFDTDCLTAPSNIRSDTVYYFEIPVGAGEFAIGSVNGKDGGYLLYLDISTYQGDSVITREKMVINTVEYELPQGVIFSGADRTVFEVPVSMTGNIVFTVNNGTVTATSPLTASSASSVKTIEKVTVSDQVGEFSIRRTTEDGNVTYEYSERPLTPADSIEELAAYFNSSVNSAVYTYNYLLEGNNSVNNTSGDIEYSTDVGIAITRYEITARAIVEAVTAMVQEIDPGASYIEFNGGTNIQTSQTITIPT